jgi:beta-lactamase class A
MHKALKLITAFLTTLFLAPAAHAQTAPPPADPLRARAEQLVPFLNGEARAEDLFTPYFLSQIPAAQLQALTASTHAQHGRAEAVDSLTPAAAHRGTVRLRLERATLRVQLVIEPAPPHRIEGLLIDGADPRGDSMAALLSDFEALPGSVSFALARLGADKPELLHQLNGARSSAIGSEFKLFLLAELSRQVASGKRRWSDVVPLDRRSHPSGMLQSWPRGAPLTLHSLAALMISISDNTATDVLLAALGREKVEALLPTLGIADPGRTRPLLATAEATALKHHRDPALAAAWAAADEGGRRALLPRLADLPEDALDLTAAGTAPRLIDSAEWFASAGDMVRTMDWLRRHGGRETLDILAINPGLGPAAAEKFAYMGFKGGSEPGVIALTFLLQTKHGTWLALSASWNNPETAVDEARFITLLNRTVALAAAL